MAGWADLGVVPADAVAAVRSRASDRRRAHPRDRVPHPPRRARVHRIGVRAGRARGAVVPLRADLVGRRRHRAGAAAARRRRAAAGGRRPRRARGAVRAEEHRHTPTIGRTHGVHAEPTTFGLKLLGWVTELRRDRDRLAAAFEGVRVGKLSGAVGTYANCRPPRSRTSPCRRSGLEREDVATQVIPRDRHAALLARDRRSPARRSTGSPPRSATCSAPRCARCWSRSPRARRARRRCRTSRTRSCASGSAAWPGCFAPTPRSGSRTWPLWHERDISHSSAERVVLPDSTIALDYMLDRFTWLVEGLVVRSRADAAQPGGVARAGVLRPGAAGAGGGRRRPASDAYEVVQRNALRAWDEETAAARPAGGRPRGGGASWTRPRSTGSSTSTASCATSTTCSTAPPSGWGWPVPDDLAALHEASGKVRELYRFGEHDADGRLRPHVGLRRDHADRRSRDKGRVLTALSRFWFDQHGPHRPQPHDLDRLPEAFAAQAMARIPT